MISGTEAGGKRRVLSGADGGSSAQGFWQRLRKRSLSFRSQAKKPPLSEGGGGAGEGSGPGEGAGDGSGAGEGAGDGSGAGDGAGDGSGAGDPGEGSGAGDGSGLESAAGVSPAAGLGLIPGVAVVPGIGSAPVVGSVADVENADGPASDALARHSVNAKESVVPERLMPPTMR